MSQLNGDSGFLLEPGDHALIITRNLFLPAQLSQLTEMSTFFGALLSSKESANHQLTSLEIDEGVGVTIGTEKTRSLWPLTRTRSSDKQFDDLGPSSPPTTAGSQKSSGPAEGRPNSSASWDRPRGLKSPPVRLPHVSQKGKRESKAFRREMTQRLAARIAARLGVFLQLVTPDPSSTWQVKVLVECLFLILLTLGQAMMKPLDSSNSLSMTDT